MLRWQRDFSRWVDEKAHRSVESKCQSDQPGHAMKFMLEIVEYPQKFFARIFALFGGAMLTAGLVLFAYQVYLYVDLGVWGKLPALSLFVEPSLPLDELQASSDLEKFLSSPSRQLPAPVRELVVYEELYSVVPGWFRSRTSWFVEPDRLYGLHNISTWLLDFLSIPAFACITGLIVLSLGLRVYSLSATNMSEGKN